MQNPTLGSFYPLMITERDAAEADDLLAEVVEAPFTQVKDNPKMFMAPAGRRAKRFARHLARQLNLELDRIFVARTDPGYSLGIHMDKYGSVIMAAVMYLGEGRASTIFPEIKRRIESAHGRLVVFDASLQHFVSLCGEQRYFIRMTFRPHRSLKERLVEMFFPPKAPPMQPPD